MRRIADDDSGAVAVIVAILAVVLFGMAALVIDVGRLYEERRELQNGADAAALAVGWECVQVGVGTANCPGDGTFAVLGATVTSYARDYASWNAGDGVASVLGTSEINLAENWIQVDLESDQDVDPIFSGVLGFGGQTVWASAAVETIPGGFAPLAFGTCELVYMLGGSMNENGEIINSSGVSVGSIEELGIPSGDVVFGYQGGGPVYSTCQEPSQQDKEKEDGATGIYAATGSFGWLPDDDCRTELGLIPEPLWVEVDSGASPSKAGCTAADFVGTVSFLVYDTVKDFKGPPTQSLLCDPSAVSNPITCYRAFRIVEIDISYVNIQGKGGEKCPALPPSAKNSKCIQGELTGIFSVSVGIDRTRSVRLIEPLPNPK